MRMLSLLFVLLAVAGVLLIVPCVRAQNMDFAVTVPVSDTSNAQRTVAFATALDKVLTRAVGADITGTPGYADALAAAADLVQSYQYQHAAVGASPAFLLQVYFAPVAVRQLATDLRGQVNTGSVAMSTHSSGRQVASIWVTPMDSGLDLVCLLATLRVHAKVVSVDPVGADGDGVMLRMRTRKAWSGVLDSLSSTGYVQPDTSAHPGADASLRWLR